MSFEIPDDRGYLETHEWAHRADESNESNGTDGAENAGDRVQVGISDFAQDELGDVVFVEVPAVGDSVDAGGEFGVVESIKAVSDLYAPLSGEVIAINDGLIDTPELVNDDPYGEGWMLEIDPSDDAEFDDLLSADEYREQTE